ncbi:MAG: hypothetical protein HRU31_11240 [Rhodobacteraceae bacterium]|nr:hypothetical protein [Paracoccaceae bacterium]
MPHQLPAVLAYLRDHLPDVNWVMIARNDMTADALARHIAGACDLTFAEAREILSEAADMSGLTTEHTVSKAA